MKSIKELLILGPGPSSSHTIGPYRISLSFLDEIKKWDVKKVKVCLYGSLALTGKGHSTDAIIEKAFEEYPFECEFNPTLENLEHPNTMECFAYLSDGSVYKKRYHSIGGGAFRVEGEKPQDLDVYPFHTFDGMKTYMEENHIDDIYEVIVKNEKDGIFEFGKEMLVHSFKTVESALEKEGTLPGPLKLQRVAKHILSRAKTLKDDTDRRLMYLTSYAYATAEANANNELIVTTPTCGAAGVVPACLYYEWKNHHENINNLVKSYLVGALICSFIKENAGVAGALLGCQSEIGSAASFASASLAYLHSLSTYQIEYASEVAMEHFLGLTCDPVDGYVQIPCIERNGMAAIHAYSSYLFAKNISLYRKNKVSFDNVIQAMKETGNELPSELKETSLGGLAKVILC
jgi:L-serine dehydratase